MGLCATAKGLTAKTEFNCGYITYHRFITEIVRVAYDERCYQIFCNAIDNNRSFTKEEIEYWNDHCNNDLDILIFHSDCDGKFTPQQCRKIHNAMKDLKSNLKGHNYIVMESYNMFEHWKAMFLHCAKNRVNLYYS